MTGTAKMAQLLNLDLVLDGNQQILQAVPIRHGVMDVVGGDVLDADLLRQQHELSNERLVITQEVIVQFDEEVFFAEQVSVAPGDGERGAPIPPEQRGRDRPVAAPGERDQPVGTPFECVGGEFGFALSARRAVPE